jgi:16S rRNA (guanine966-N2)-methyltransferase
MRRSSRPKSPSKNAQAKPSSLGEVRIIGGTLRGRKIQFNTVEGLRPSLDRIRETAFNWLNMDIAGSICLDLFSGSGAMAFEAVSRGADRVVMVEKDKMACTALSNNKSKLDLSNVEIIHIDALDFLRSNQSKFDLVFLDPPFDKGLLEPTLGLLPQHLSNNALVYIEQEVGNTAFTPPNDLWCELKYKKTSRFSYALYQYQPKQPEANSR